MRIPRLCPQRFLLTLHSQVSMKADLWGSFWTFSLSCVFLCPALLFSDYLAKYDTIHKGPLPLLGDKRFQRQPDGCVDTDWSRRRDHAKAALSEAAAEWGLCNRSADVARKSLRRLLSAAWAFSPLPPRNDKLSGVLKSLSAMSRACSDQAFIFP